jgi:hypothetical protein
MSNTILLPFQPDSMSRAQLAAVSYLARYSGHTHSLYAYQLRRWFGWCETNRLDPLWLYSHASRSAIAERLSTFRQSS